MKNIVKQTFVCLLALLGGASLTGCGSDETYSEYERTQASFAA